MEAESLRNGKTTSEEEGEDFDRIYDSHVKRREADLEDSNVRSHQSLMRGNKILQSSDSDKEMLKVQRQ